MSSAVSISFADWSFWLGQICIPGSLDPVEIAAAQRQVLRSITDESHVTRGNFINMRLRLGKAEEKIKQLTEKVHTTEQEKTAVQAAAEALKRQLAEAASAISHLQLQLNLVHDLWNKSEAQDKDSSQTHSSQLSNYEETDSSEPHSARVSSVHEIFRASSHDIPAAPIRPNTARPPSGRPATGFISGRPQPCPSYVR